MKIIYKIAEAFRLLLTGKSDSAVYDGILDFRGQGKDRYGR